MEFLSIFDIFKIGVGPSSSHTLGPWNAALDFVQKIRNKKVDKIQIELYGSLSKTGKGHCTDIAVQLGLSGHSPIHIDTKNIQVYIDTIKNSGTIKIDGNEISFDANHDIIFKNSGDIEHPNTLVIKAWESNRIVLSNTYYSVGGGFIETKGKKEKSKSKNPPPYPIQNAKELLAYTAKDSLSIPDIVHKNELHLRSEAHVLKNIEIIYTTMIECVYKGCTSDGILPGGLKVKRRSKALCDSLLDPKSHQNVEQWMLQIRKSKQDFNSVNKWISCFALAINEENADLGKVVTSPTNGAAGVIPAVLLYHILFSARQNKNDIRNFLYTSGEIGSIFKKGATISAAVGGCQAEIGVSSAMAAGGLTEVAGGSPEQVLMAAEIAMEHHLGMTCDPIGGLVQIPCIERNTMGAIKAITASNLALAGNPKDAKVNLDVVIKTMWDTAQEMNDKYKETSEGGLAFNLPVVFPEC